jgi:hypothetical protein
MGQPDQGAAEVARVQAIQDNAKRLGLVWQWSPATVTSIDPLQAQMDGDTASIGVASAMGAVSVGERVYVMAVPPAGNFLLGRCLPQPLLRARLTTGTLLTGAATSIPWDTFDEQLGQWFRSALPATAIFIPEDGIYQVSATASFSAAAGAGSRQDMTIQTTSSVPGWLSTDWRGSWSNGGSIGSAHATLRFNAGDQFAVRLFQNTTASMTYFANLTAVRKSG